jgi:hypothetical protein
MSKSNKKSNKSKKGKQKKIVYSGTPGPSVRKKDKNNNTYFIDRETGKRVSRSRWEFERKQIEKQKTKSRSDVKKHLDIVKQPPATHFPEYVDPVGVPKRKSNKDFTYDSDYFEGESFEVEDFEPFAIEGEDETG